MEFWISKSTAQTWIKKRLEAAMDHIIGASAFAAVVAIVSTLAVVSHPKPSHKAALAKSSRPIAASSSPTAKPQPITKSAAYAQEVSSTLERHFKAIQRGRYTNAWKDLVGETTKVGEPQWVSENREANLRAFNLKVKVRVIHAREAKAAIVYFKTYEDGGCEQWGGYWTLIRSSGRWLINYAELKPRKCSL